MDNPKYFSKSNLPSSYFRISVAELCHNLHWLPVNNRIDFKIAVITYKLLAQNQPT
jgi:hypothetical protein